MDILTKINGIKYFSLLSRILNEYVISKLQKMLLMCFSLILFILKISSVFSAE